MKKKAVLQFALALLLMLHSGAFLKASSDGTDDLPHDGEPFATYFARLTRGGTFPGIYLKASTEFQPEFLTAIQKGHWVGDLNNEIKSLKTAHIDVWQNWYALQNPIEILQAMPASQLAQTADRSADSFATLFNLERKNLCGAVSAPTDWTKTSRCLREAIARVIVFQLRDQTGQTLIGRIAARYGLVEQEMVDNVDVFIETEADFAATLRRMGYSGPIYFRGITGPDPANSKRHWIALNHDLMLKMTPFSHPVLQMLEYAAILSHEFNHVAQDLAGRKFGGDIGVRNAESALVIEGMAEYLNELTWLEFSKALPTNPLALFTREQAVEIVYRPGNETTGSLFPYTIGVPFAEAFYGFATSAGEPRAQTDRKLLDVLSGNATLETWIGRKN